MILLLIFIDMAVKLIVTHFFMGSSKLLFSGLIGFKPHINTEQMGINLELSRFGLSISNTANIILNIFILFFIVVLVGTLSQKKEYGKRFAVGACLVIAATVCSLLDKLFWGGSPDYIYVIYRYIIDIKDIYFLCITIMLTVSAITTITNKISNTTIISAFSAKLFPILSTSLFY